MQWRMMQADDLDAVSAVSDAVHGRYTEPRAVYAERRTLYPQGAFVLDDGEPDNSGQVTGYLIVHPWHRAAPPALGALIHAIPADADSLYLHDVALLPSMRGTGSGAKATQMALDLALAEGFRDVFLLAVAGADSFWASRGFAPVEDDALAAKLRADYGPEVIYMHRRIG